MKIPFIGIAVLALTACATGNVAHDYALEATRAEGLVVVSLSHEGLRPGERTVWLYRRLDGTVKDRLLSSNLRDALDWQAPEGRLAYFALAPGRYEFYGCGFVRSGPSTTTSWHLNPSGVPVANNHWFAGFDAVRHVELDAEPFSVPFEVVAGKATYIGNLHLRWSDAAHKGVVVRQDRAERDLGLLRQRLPGVRSGDVVKETSAPKQDY